MRLSGFRANREKVAVATVEVQYSGETGSELIQKAQTTLTNWPSTVTRTTTSLDPMCTDTIPPIESPATGIDSSSTPVYPTDVSELLMRNSTLSLMIPNTCPLDIGVSLLILVHLRCRAEHPVLFPCCIWSLILASLDT
jgi:hypothetical protein